jgi:hypothetical protein
MITVGVAEKRATGTLRSREGRCLTLSSAPQSEMWPVAQLVCWRCDFGTALTVTQGLGCAESDGVSAQIRCSQVGHVRHPLLVDSKPYSQCRH